MGEAEGEGEAEAGEINEKELSEQLLDAVGKEQETSEFPGSASGEPAEVTNLTPEDLDLGDVDWQDVNDEVDAAMMESDSEEDDRRSSASGRSSNVGEDESDFAMEEVENVSRSVLCNTSSQAHIDIIVWFSLPTGTPRRERKRLRSLTPSEVGSLQDALRSPLAKRKKIAASRSGLSPLKETLNAKDFERDENVDSDDSRPTTPTPQRGNDALGEEEDEEEEESEGEEIDDDFLARELAEELG